MVVTEVGPRRDFFKLKTRDTAFLAKENRRGGVYPRPWDLDSRAPRREDAAAWMGATALEASI